MEKQREKAAKRLQRKLEPKATGEAGTDDAASELDSVDKEAPVGDE